MKHFAGLFYNNIVYKLKKSSLIIFAISNKNVMNYNNQREGKSQVKSGKFRVKG